MKEIFRQVTDAVAEYAGRPLDRPAADDDRLAGGVAGRMWIRKTLWPTGHRVFLVAATAATVSASSLRGQLASFIQNGQLPTATDRNGKAYTQPSPTTEMVDLGRRIEELERPAAAKRKREGGRASGKASGKLLEASSGDTRDKVAAAIGVGAKTFEKGEAGRRGGRR